MKLKLISLTVILVAMAAIFSACGSTANNAVNTNANTRVTNLNANSNRWSNANSVTREEYTKNRAEYENEKGSSKIGSGANDSWIWFKTRAALLTTNDLRESTINVDVTNDVTTLRGTVASAAEKTKAEQVAKAVDGVKSVKNDLKVAANDSMMNTSDNSSKGNTNTKK